VTVADLVAGIERRQRGLDAQQEEVQAEIAKLLSADWFSAVDRCQSLLDATTSTLRELNEILLRDTHHFVALLQEIQALATATENTDAEATVQRVIEHVDRIAAWGGARQRAWSEYYQYVHRYLRDVVRLDPDRALSQRLRDQLAGWPRRPFHLVTAHAPSIRLLRALEARVERPPVARPRAEREADPEWVDPENLLADIDALVARALDEGKTTLAARAKKSRAAAEAARVRHLTKLARDVEGAWSKLEKLVAASDYDVAVKLAIDLRDLATQEATAPAFARRFEALRKRQLRRRGFFDRWKRANENDSRDR
jgi:chromosome condensin MukBEF complex kleisin-like MukF subunit